MENFTTLHSRVVPLPIDNIDTDQIIPARFLKGTDKDGLGVHLFADWRYRGDGTLIREFALNHPDASQSAILLAGDNFGCGSSREHAPWALKSFGFRAVVSTSFADIFRNNALRNGILPVQIDKDAHAAMFEVLKCKPKAEFTIDLQYQTVVWPEGHEAHFPIDSFAKTCLLHGVDELGFILGLESKIVEYEATR